MNVYEETGDFVVEKLDEWKKENPELDSLADKLLEYQQELQVGNISKFEYDRLVFGITDIEEINKKLDKAIDLDKAQEALDFLKFLAQLAARVIIIV